MNIIGAIIIDIWFILVDMFVGCRRSDWCGKKECIIFIFIIIAEITSSVSSGWLVAYFEQPGIKKDLLLVKYVSVISFSMLIILIF